MCLAVPAYKENMVSRIELRPIDIVRHHAMVFKKAMHKWIDTEKPVLEPGIPIESAFLLSHVSPKVDITPEEIVVRFLANAMIVREVWSGVSMPFIIEDMELVDAALDSRLKDTVILDEIRLPFPGILVQVPRRRLFGDQYWDVMHMGWGANWVPNRPGSHDRLLNVMFCDTTTALHDGALGIMFNPVGGGSLDPEYVVGLAEHKYVLADNVPDDILAAYDLNSQASEETRLCVLEAIKMAMFLVSEHKYVEIVHRGSVPRKGSVAVRNAYRSYRTIKITLGDIQKKYEDSRPKSTSKSTRARSYTRGHFKIVRRGRVAENYGGPRPVWCPPYWSGVLKGPVVDKEYEVVAAKE